MRDRHYPFVTTFLICLVSAACSVSHAEQLDSEIPSVQGSAQDETVKLKQVTVTATRTERATDLTSKPVTVITREQIESRNPRSVQELLGEVPGVSLSRSGGLGAQITLRGFNSNGFKTLLLIDGDRFRGRNALEYSLLDPNEVERIEVIRGPASTLYGPDALAGVVNIITRRASGDVTGPFELTPRLRALNYNSVNDLFGARAELQGLGDGFDMLLGVNGRTADDYESPEGEIPNSDFASLSTDLKLGYTPTPGHRFELAAKYANVESGQPGGLSGAPGPPLIVRREDPIIERFAKLSYSGRNSALNLAQIEASLYAREILTDIAVDSRTVANRFSQTENFVGGPVVVGGKLFSAIPWGSGVLTTLGTDFFHEMNKGTEQASRVTNLATGAVTVTPRTQGGPDSDQTDIGLFVHNEWDASERWTFSAGGRVDYIRTTTESDPLPTNAALRELFESSERESTETPVTGGLGLIFRPWEVLHFTGNINKAFRAPSTSEKFGLSRTSTGFLIPNPDLESEESLTYEIGTRLRMPQFSADLTAFRSDYDNLIVRSSVAFEEDGMPVPSTQRQNAGEAEVQGLELNANWAFAEKWGAFMNASHVRGTDTTEDEPLAYIPPLNGLLGVRYSSPRGFYVEGLSRWSLRKDRINSTEERETAGFAVFDLYAGVDLWRLAGNLPEMQLTFGLENIFDKAYRQPTTIEAINFPQSITNPLLEPGRAVSVTLRSRF